MSKSSGASADRNRSYKPKRGTFAGRTFASRQDYRIALAQERASSLPHVRQRATRPARSVAELEALTPLEREANRAAFHALDLMRDGLSRAQAARRAGTTPASMMRHVGPALEQRGRRWVARPADRLLRVMQLLTEGGREERVAIRGSRVASLVSRHWRAIYHYLDTGDDTLLRELTGMRAGGYVLETDPDRIDTWQLRGELSVEDIYSLTS